MSFLYSLYDALTSINVPNDKARDVVDAMERDMASTIATKADLQLLEQKLSSELALVRKDMEILGNRIDNRIDGLPAMMTVRLGSMLMVGLGILFAALKLT